MVSKNSVSERKYFRPNDEVIAPPNLIEVQLDSYRWFLEEGLKEIFEELNPVEDFIGKNLELYFLDYKVEEPKYSEDDVRTRNLTYKAAVRCRIRLVNKNTGEIKEQSVFLGDFPLMTDQGTFIINGIERVVVSQIVRSPGVLFTSDNSSGTDLFGAKIIPDRGAWLELETSSKNIISVKIDRKRKIPITTLLKAFGLGDNDQLIKLFADVDTDPDRPFIRTTLEKDPATTMDAAILDVYRRIRPGDLVTVENAKTLVDNMFFNFRRYDFSKVGRYKINKRLNLDIPNDIAHRVLQKEDIVAVVREIIRLNNDPDAIPDNIDHLKNRRVRAVGELVQRRVRIGFLRVERMIKDRMSVVDIESVTPAQLINVRPITAVLQEHFASSQLSQFMDQTNLLSELEHKRRLSAMGPGGLSRERAGFEVRDVHSSHYGRLCPVETPEGPNIGLIAYFATYVRVNEYGFMETPYIYVQRKAKNDGRDPIGHTLREDVVDGKGKTIAKKDEKITKELAEKFSYLKIEKILVKPRVTGQVMYLDAEEDEKNIIAQANSQIDKEGYFVEKRVAVRNHSEPDVVAPEKIDYMDVSTRQIVGVTASLIPFVEHDEVRRALMGSNMLRQAVPLVKSKAPIVGTGMEEFVARNSGQMLIAKNAGTVKEITDTEIIVSEKGGVASSYKLRRFVRSNDRTCISHKVLVNIDDKVEAGDILADGMATDRGEAALGQNVFVAFMTWSGFGFEDAIIVSERLVHDDIYSSIHIEDYSIEVRDTKLGPEIVTRDIPNVGDEALKNLDEMGIIRIGAEVKAGDILVGKITPKGETELTPEERLLRAIFGEKARDVKDVSLRLPHGEYGKVVDVREFHADRGDELSSGVITKIEVSVAQFRKIVVGDKMAGRHGNKGIVSKVLPAEDMPMLADGTPIDMILNPLGVISRMNLGQLLETHLGYAASKLGYKAASPVFRGISFDEIVGELKKAGLPEDGKVQLYDGRTGEPFGQKTTVGIKYMMKLSHLVDDKIHARSIGPYSLVTQQPLGGRAQFGGQRFGEMEVWALEAYGAAHTLQEMLTIKSDDVWGRSKAYESIIKNEEIKKPSIPESFNVLVKELEGLGLAVELIRESEEGEEIIDAEKVADQGIEDLNQEATLNLGEIIATDADLAGGGFSIEGDEGEPNKEISDAPEEQIEDLELEEESFDDMPEKSEEMEEEIKETE
ncbi:DNA-directed RNA polymerase subunit beta [Candidatus Microgenomates bacterium]|nr:DNA-directed RNA polymerase subunit beta [Candidatus Microgenomates bacterium]